MLLRNIFINKYKIRKDLLKEKLQKVLFSKLYTQENKSSTIQECTEEILKIFSNSLTEAEEQTEEKALGFKNSIYYDLWYNSLVKHFAEILNILIERLGKDSENIHYLCELK